MSKKIGLISFIALAISMFMSTLDSTIINIALPDIMKYFNANIGDTSWISTIYVLSLSVFMITASKFADQFGRKKIMIAGLVIFGVASALCGMSQSLLFLIIMRFIQGIGGAIITPVVLPMCIEIFGKDRSQSIAGKVGAVVALAAASGPPIGGFFIKYLNWKAIFFVNVPFSILSLILIALFIKESYDKTSSKSIDWGGMLFLSSSLFFLTFALLKGNDYGWGSLNIILMFAGALVSFVAFLILEAHVKAPMIELSLFREKTFTASSLCYLLTGFGIASPILVFNYFLQNVLGYEVLKAALIIMPVSLTVIVAMPLGNLLASKFGGRFINLIGLFSLGAGSLLLSRLNINSSDTTMVSYMMLCGFGVGFSCQSIVTSIKYIPKEKSGIGSGIVNSARQIGTCIGIALLIGILNTNAVGAREGIRKDVAAVLENHENVNQEIKTVIQDNINKSLDNSNNDNSAGMETVEKLKKEIKEKLESLSSVEKPQNNETLVKLYDYTAELHDGAEKMNQGQAEFNKVLEQMDSGLGKLGSGVGSLSAGVDNLSDIISKADEGMRILDSSYSQGIVPFKDGIQKLDSGAARILGQFSTGGSSGNPTIYDGIAGIEKGLGEYSSAIRNYVAGINNTIFYMIKSNPASAQALTEYIKSLEQLQAVYANADSSSKEDYLRQMGMLENLITLYTAALDSSVTDAGQFAVKITQGKNAETGKQNVIAAGIQITDGASRLQNASKSIKSQFDDGGVFKSGVEQLAQGLDILNVNTGKLDIIGTGISKMSDGLSKMKQGSEELSQGSKIVENGIISAKEGSSSLLIASSQLLEAGGKLSESAGKINSGIGLAGQSDEIQKMIEEIVTYKNDRIVDTYSKTFIIAAIILMITSLVGLFTDRKIQA